MGTVPTTELSLPSNVHNNIFDNVPLDFLYRIELSLSVTRYNFHLYNTGSIEVLETACKKFCESSLFLLQPFIKMWNSKIQWSSNYIYVSCSFYWWIFLHYSKVLCKSYALEGIFVVCDTPLQNLPPVFCFCQETFLVWLEIANCIGLPLSELQDQYFWSLQKTQGIQFHIPL